MGQHGAVSLRSRLGAHGCPRAAARLPRRSCRLRAAVGRYFRRSACAPGGLVLGSFRRGLDAARRCRRLCARSARCFSASRVGSDIRLDEWPASRRPVLRRRGALGPHRGDALLLGDLNRVRLQAGDGGDVHVGMHDRHEGMPDRGCEMAAGRARRHGTVVVVAEPHRSHVLAGEADEPDVLRPRRWSRSCRRRW